MVFLDDEFCTFLQVFFLVLPLLCGARNIPGHGVHAARRHRERGGASLVVIGARAVSAKTAKSQF